MRISDWSSDVCSSDLIACGAAIGKVSLETVSLLEKAGDARQDLALDDRRIDRALDMAKIVVADAAHRIALELVSWLGRSEERRVGKECVSTVRSRWAASISKKNTQHAKCNMPTVYHHYIPEDTAIIT